MRISILGPLVVTDSGRPVSIGGARLRALLVRLALDVGRSVRTDVLVEAVWGDEPPAGAANALQTLVSRLRRALPPEALTGDPTGYRLDADVDATEFEQRVRAARTATDAAETRALLADALALWRGPALVDVADLEFARATVTRLDESHVTATEDWLAARAALEPAADLAPDLEAFAAIHPLRERPHALLITALAETGRQADAVRAYEQLRARLGDELGIDPSPELAARYTAMLRGERAGNVRVPLTSFVGRATDLARVTATIREHRLVTLVGPGGAGKTRLVTEAARALAGEFANGEWIVELAPVREPDGVARALAEALQIREIRYLDLTAGGAVLDRVFDALESRELLLVLDNCEHLVDAAARLAEALLGACPGVRIVTTSREPLAINGEALCPVGPLATPEPGMAPMDAGAVASVRLFVDRAAAVKPGFTLTVANTHAVTEICRRLDGMPLAIELACARLRTMPVEAIAERLDDRFRLLTGGSRTALPRHQTLQAVVEWSWDLLAPDERSLAARFSVFSGGATVDTITGVCGADSLEPLGGLVDKSLVLLGDDGRYRMLETIRSYAAEQLAESGQAAVARTRHASFFTTTVERADRHMRDAQQVRWLRWMSEERDNLAGALRWAIDSGDAAIAVRLAGALGWFWLLCDYHVEAAQWLGQALALPGEVPPAARALALTHYGINAMANGDQTKVDDVFAEARSLGSDHPLVAMSEAMGGMFGDDFSRTSAGLPKLLAHPDPWVRAMGTTVGAVVAVYTGAAEEAERGLIAALRQFEIIGDQWARATLTSVLGEMQGLRGDRAGAIESFRVAAALGEELGVPEVTAGVLMSLCVHEARIGDLDGARRDLERARQQAARGVSPQMTAQLRGAEAEIARRGGDLVTARAQYREVVASVRSARGIAREIVAGLMHGQALAEIGLGDASAGAALAGEIFDLAIVSRGRMGLSMCATVCMAVADVTDRPADTAYLIGIGDAVRGVVDASTPELIEAGARARKQLGDEGYESAYARGHGLEFADAIEVLRIEVGR